jgi:hypothetical protein
MGRRAQPKSERGWHSIGLGLALLAGGPLATLSQTASVSVTPAADAFVRSLAPQSNFGAAGALAVSGSGAVNGSGQQNGLFDSLLRFPLAGVASSFNASFGTNGWVVMGATLTVTESATPNNAVFNRGIRAFEIRWIASDTWVEGSGTPNSPAADGVVYLDLSWVLNPALDLSLGRFTNSGVSGPVSFPLPPAEPVVSTLSTGGNLNLYVTAASAPVGFTFNSRNFGTSSAWPSLQMTAAVKPVAVIKSVAAVGTNQVAIRFQTASNWTYHVEGASGVSSGVWSNLFTVPAKPFDSQAEFVDQSTNQQRFYRLLLLP